jgi:Flp pilus assembly protein TadD
MAELWLQLLPQSTNDLPLLAQAYQQKMTKTLQAYQEFLLRLNPANGKAHSDLAQLLLAQGHTADALVHLRKSCELTPDADQPHYLLGIVLRQSGQLAEAQRELETAVRLNPQNYKAHGNLGLIAVSQNRIGRAEAHFRAALRINPDDQIARSMLEELQHAKPEGESH